jgi:hypothetical protein
MYAIWKDGKWYSDDGWTKASGAARRFANRDDGKRFGSSFLTGSFLVVPVPDRQRRSVEDSQAAILVGSCEYCPAEGGGCIVCNADRATGDAGLN